MITRRVVCYFYSAIKVTEFSKPKAVIIKQLMRLQKHYCAMRLLLMLMLPMSHTLVRPRK